MAARFAHPAMPIVLGAVLLDTIGFGIILPVLPQLIGASLVFSGAGWAVAAAIAIVLWSVLPTVRAEAMNET